MTEKKGWFSKLGLAKLTSGLKKTSTKITHGITSIFTNKKLDEETLQELEDLLITSDINLKTTQKLLAPLRKTRFGQEVTEAEIRLSLAHEMTKILEPHAQPLTLLSGQTNVVVVVGVNGSGKTTTISKMAKSWRDQGYSVRLVAGDTFRAAAVAQLKIWGERLGIPVMSTSEKGDAAGLAYEAYQLARSRNEDVLLIDTAGRLHHRADLMAELEKIDRVLKKINQMAPHQCIMVLDATTGQNLFAQVETFAKYIKMTGLIMTKLDGTAKGGVLIGLADHFGLPIHAIGIGEAADDFRDFEAHDFATTLLGVEGHESTSP